jgi:hypothetical protein
MEQGRGKGECCGEAGECEMEVVANTKSDMNLGSGQCNDSCDLAPWLNTNHIVIWERDKGVRKRVLMKKVSRKHGGKLFPDCHYWKHLQRLPGGKRGA